MSWHVVAKAAANEASMPLFRYVGGAMAESARVARKNPGYLQISDRRGMQVRRARCA